MRKFVLLGVLFLMLPLVNLQAKGLGSSFATPVAPDYGNNWSELSIPPTTGYYSLISSVPASSPDQPYDWRHREIVNCSNGTLQLLSKRWTTLMNTSYSQFSDTFSVVLGSGAFGLGDSWVVPSTYGEVWGIWSSSTSLTGPGACGSESYQK